MNLLANTFSIMLPGVTLNNVLVKERICNCEAHTNERIRQIEARLPNGTPVVVMLDSGGYHVGIGRNAACSAPMSKAAAVKLLRDAMRR
jgi:hypothetical protein